MTMRTRYDGGGVYKKQKIFVGLLGSLVLKGEEPRKDAEEKEFILR